MIEIESATGPTRYVRINHFAPLDGWELQNKFIDFARSKDAEFRRAYTMQILGYATLVFDDGREMDLATSAVIDNHLETWQNIQLVFNEVLKANGVDPLTHAEDANYWSKAGSEMAIAFLAEASKLMGPAIDMAAQANAAKV